jgi:digeranylgeranylglycerophospholipid reductase
MGGPGPKSLTPAGRDGWPVGRIAVLFVRPSTFIAFRCRAALTSDTNFVMYEIAIVGGGPGGLHAAYRLARSGFKVTVFEEHDSAGDPVHCTGVLAAEAFEEFDLPRTSFLNALTTVQFFGPSGDSIEYSTAQTEAIVIDRRAFDRALGKRAENAGVVLRVGERITDVRVLHDEVRLTTAAGNFVTAKACILACGANYALQKRLGLGMPVMHMQSAQIEVPALEPGHVEVHFGNDIAPKGFAWAVPVLRGHRTFARIGLMCERDAREYFDRFLSRVGPRWKTGTPTCLGGGILPRIKMLPLGPIARTYAARVLAVGDAAGLVKATTGGGIYYSLVSGSLAAETLVEAFRQGDLSAASLSVYEERWRQQLSDEFSAQMSLRRIANRLSDAEIDDLFELARTDGIMPMVRKTARFNKHRDLIVSLLSHQPARRVLMRRVLGWGRTA